MKGNDLGYPLTFTPFFLSFKFFKIFQKYLKMYIQDDDVS